MNKLIVTVVVIGVSVLLGILIMQHLGSPGRDRTHHVMKDAGNATLKVTALNKQLDALSEVDEGLVLYRELEPIVPEGLNELTAIAVGADDTIYAGGGKTVLVSTPQGDVLRRLTVAADVSCLAVDVDRILYVGLGNAVQAYDAEGNPGRTFSTGRNDAIFTSIAASGGELFVADAQNQSVIRFSLGGVIQGMIDGKRDGNAGGGFIIPSPYFDIVPGQGQTLWIVNPGYHRLEEYSFDGDFIGSWGRENGTRIDDFCGCCNPSHVARLNDGSFVTSEKGLTRVKIYTRRGGFVGVVASPKQLGDQALGLDLAVDSHDRVLVADPARKQVRVFERKTP